MSEKPASHAEEGPLRSVDPFHDYPMSGARLTRYQQLAEEIADGIRAGLLRPGDPRFDAALRLLGELAQTA